MNQYLFLLRETPADSVEPSPAELRAIISRYSEWSHDLRRRDLMVTAEKLVDDGGLHVRTSGSHSGSFADQKDVVSGFFVVKADSDDAAVALAATCPHVEGSKWIEVRRIDNLG